MITTGGEDGPGDDETSVFVDNAEVRLHVLDNGRRSAAPPAVVIPGMGEYADEYAWLLDRLGDRRVLVIDLRGRGRSDTPGTGYTWEDHIGDLRAVITSLDLEQPILVAFSRGSSYALGYALHHPGQVSGLVVGDYHARHVGLRPEFAEQQLRSEIRGVPVASRMPERAVRGVVAQSREVPLWDRLRELRCPVLVIRGTRRGRIVTDELAQRWQTSLPTVEIATVPGAGHDLWSRDPDSYLAALIPFLNRFPTPPSEAGHQA
ncbi:alpha/beta fold hydrolase [Nocardia alni]|uniref:alpha/beta fold hydrolase n=1 Tax=Nocardia alni TaxID=2815723 RepID=UPI001C223995|nr:alpha/beta hydrolase [Nocardia alni]